MAGPQGLNSPNMDDKTKHDIHSAGGKASHGGGRTGSTNRSSNVTTNSSGGGRLTQADKAKGGRNSHSSSNS
jgi:hypothetical protein